MRPPCESLFLPSRNVPNTMRWLLLLAAVLGAAAPPPSSETLCHHTTDRTLCASRACRWTYAWCEICGRCMPAHRALVKDEL